MPPPLNGLRPIGLVNRFINGAGLGVVAAVPVAGLLPVAVEVAVMAVDDSMPIATSAAALPPLADGPGGGDSPRSELLRKRRSAAARDNMYCAAN